jgi:putative hydrolase of the HAD superfamily
MQNETLDRELIDRLRSLGRPLVPEPTRVPPRLTALGEVRAVLFDVYGTLVISGSGDVGTSVAGRGRERALAEALRAARLAGDADRAAREGVSLLDRHIHADHEERRAAGCAHPEVEIREIWQRVLDDLAAAGLLPGRPGAAAIARLAVEYEGRANPAWPMPGLRPLLAELRAKRLHLGIVSNAQFYTPLLLNLVLGAPLAEAGLEPDLCAWSYRHREAKPSAALFRDPLTCLAQQHGVRPDQTLYVGNDMLNDMWPAGRCGMRTALFAGDTRSYRPREGDPRVEGTRPDVVVTALSQLAACLMYNA